MWDLTIKNFRTKICVFFNIGRLTKTLMFYFNVLYRAKKLCCLNIRLLTKTLMLFYIEQVIRNCGHFLLTNLAQSSKFAVTQKIEHKNMNKSSNLVHFALKSPKVVTSFLSWSPVWPSISQKPHQKSLRGDQVSLIFIKKCA